MGVGRQLFRLANSDPFTLNGNAFSGRLFIGPVCVWAGFWKRAAAIIYVGGDCGGIYPDQIVYRQKIEKYLYLCRKARSGNDSISFNAAKKS